MNSLDFDHFNTNKRFAIAVWMIRNGGNIYDINAMNCFAYPNQHFHSNPFLHNLKLNY
jgi:hypothetical protein